MPLGMLRKHFPRWMAIRDDPNSVGGVLLDTLESHLNAIVDPTLQRLIEDGVITTAREEQASWLVEVLWEDGIELPDYPLLTIQATLSDGSVVSIQEVPYLSELALGYHDQHLAYVDREARRMVIRPPLFDTAGRPFPTSAIPDLYRQITAGGHVLTAFHPRHLWNAFDEFALKVAAKTRRYLESNRSLFKRTIYYLRYPPDSTPSGLAAAACVEAGLVAELRWPRTSSFLDLAHFSAYPETIYLCPAEAAGTEPTEAEWERAWRAGYPVHPSQLTDSPAIPGMRRIVPTIHLFSRPSDWVLDGVQITETGRLELLPGATAGTATWKVLQVGNLGRWGLLQGEVAAGGAFEIEVAPAHYQNPSDWQWVELASTAIPGVVTGTLPAELESSPLALRISLYRSWAGDPSPALQNLTLSYEPGPCVVTYLYGVSVHPLGDPALKSAFFTPEGHPTPTLRGILQRIAQEAPILWGQMRWDEHYWDTVEPGHGLASIPSKWDPDVGSLEGQPDAWQAGVGDLDDLAVRILRDSFSPYLQGGYAFSSTAGVPEPHYRFVAPASYRTDHTPKLGSYSLPSTPTPGTPLVVKLDGVPLRPVAFLDSDGTLTLQAEVQAVSDGRFLVLPHRRIDPQSVAGLPAGYSVDASAYDGSHRLPVTPALPAGNLVTLRYYLDGSFLWDGATLHVYASDARTLDVTYETAPLGESAPYPALSLSPMEHVTPAGFVYYTPQEPAVDHLEILVHPDELLADGHDWAWVEVRVLDRYGNPVRGAALTASATVGTLTSQGSYGERHVFRYTAPQLDASSVPLDATLSFQVGTVADQAVVTLR